MKIKKPTEEEIRSTLSWAYWSKEHSEFCWFYDNKETCLILEGKAEVTDAEGNSIRFQKGDWVEFDKGLIVPGKSGKSYIRDLCSASNVMLSRYSPF